MVDSFCESFYIPAEVHPTASGRDKTIAQFPADMGLLDFIKTADPRKVRAVEVQKGDDQILAPIERGQESVAEEDAYLESADPGEGTAMVRQSDEEVVTEQPKKIKKKRLTKQSDILPAKRLRTDHPSLAFSTEGKTLAGLEQIMPAGSRLLVREQSATPSVAPPQESESFMDLSAQASLQIRTTVGSSSTLSAPVDTVAATTTSTKAKLAADVNPDLAGPSQLEESEGSDDSFYELATLDPSEVKRWYVPRWNITNDSLLDDGFSCRTLVDRVAPPAFFSALRSMDCDQLYTEFNVGAARQICLGSEVRSRAEHELELKEKLNAKYAARGKLLEKKDSEILRLKSQLAEKEAETAEVVRLRDQVSSLSGEKSALTAEVSALKVTITQKDHDISLLDSRATHLESALNDAQVACTEAGTKITSLASERDRLASEVSSLHAGFKDFKEKMEIQQEEQAQELYNHVAELEDVMDVFGRLEGEFYPTYLTLLAGRRWLLTHGIQLALLKCLKSSEYQGILGHALGRAVDFGMQEGLEAGYEHGVAGRSLSVVDAYNPEVASADYVNAVKALEDAHFPLVDLLKSKKDAGMDEVLDCFLLDGPLAELPEAASLQPCIEQLAIPIHHAGDKTAVGETSLSFALMNVHARAEGAKKHAAALRQLMMDIVSAPLSSQTWVGEASISAAPLSVEDYAEEDTDEALGSVVAAPHLERYKSKLQYGDLEWFFFCPKSQKYLSGSRTNRATEAGYWKATGKDREVKYKDKIVAAIKTLVFQAGHPPKGTRTYWVMHEYRMDDKDLANAGVIQAQKTVFEEEEWDNMDDNKVISFESSAMITKDTFNSNATVTNMTLTETAPSTVTSSDNERLVVHEGANKTLYSNARSSVVTNMTTTEPGPSTVTSDNDRRLVQLVTNMASTEAGPSTITFPENETHLYTAANDDVLLDYELTDSILQITNTQLNL
ncbi:gypsy type transposase [Tanacetum coccineum]